MIRTDLFRSPTLASGWSLRFASPAKRIFQAQGFANSSRCFMTVFSKGKTGKVCQIKPAHKRFISLWGRPPAHDASGYFRKARIRHFREKVGGKFAVPSFFHDFFTCRLHTTSRTADGNTTDMNDTPLSGHDVRTIRQMARKNR